MYNYTVLIQEIEGGFYTVYGKYSQIQHAFSAIRQLETEFEFLNRSKPVAYQIITDLV